MRYSKILELKDKKMSGEYKNFLLRDKYVSMELFESMKKDIERHLMRPGLREAIEKHKSNWIPNSKGGEPNHR